jgi:hypothetical protein
MDICGAAFYNLDFEQGTTNTVSASGEAALGPIADLLPGWHVDVATVLTPAAFPPYQGKTNRLDYLWFRSAPKTFDTAALLTDRADMFPDFPKDGSFALVLGTTRGTYYYTYQTLIQRGDVPANATGLQMDGVIEWIGGETPAHATMNGVPLTSGPGSGFTPGAWDVSSFAG